MRHPPGQPRVPAERHETVRQAIADVLHGDPITAKEISGFVRVSEKEVYDHLEHIRKTAGHGAGRLEVTPSRCRKCAFVFSKRERLTKPGRCPICKGESIEQPRFALGRASG